MAYFFNGYVNQTLKAYEHLQKNLCLGFIAILLVGCTTGKNAFDKGNYETAVDRAVKRLQANPNNQKAQNVFIDGYDLAKSFHEKEFSSCKEVATDSNGKAFTMSMPV